LLLVVSPFALLPSVFFDLSPCLPLCHPEQSEGSKPTFSMRSLTALGMTLVAPFVILNEVKDLNLLYLRGPSLRSGWHLLFCSTWNNYPHSTKIQKKYQMCKSP